MIGPAGYYRDVNHLDSYRMKSSFLAELNNEKVNKNQVLKDRMLGLEKMLLIMFTKDTMILPKETAWFQSYFDNSEDL